MARMHMDSSELRREVARLNTRIALSGLAYSKRRLAHINYLVEEEEIDYPVLVEEVEALIE